MKTGKALQLFGFLKDANTSKLDGVQQSIFIQVYLELENITEEFNKGSKVAMSKLGVEQDERGNFKQSTPDQIASIKAFVEAQNERVAVEVEILGKLTREMAEIINANTAGITGVNLALLYDLIQK